MESLQVNGIAIIEARSDTRALWVVVEGRVIATARLAPPGEELSGPPPVRFVRGGCSVLMPLKLSISWCRLGFPHSSCGSRG